MRAFDRGSGQACGLRPAAAHDAHGNSGSAGSSRSAGPSSAGHLFLMPGDSPIGLRLPLGGLPEISFVDYPHVLPADPFADPARLAGRASGCGQPQSAQLRDGRARSWCGRRSPSRLRDGHLCVFLPPLADGADYAALIAAIEAAAAKPGKPVRLEGYAPPFDPRINVIKVTPDPGVIEVNVHPATSWEQAVDDHHDRLRGGCADRPGRGEIQDRRPPCRHRRRQPHRARRRHAGRQPVPAPAGPAGQHHRLLAEPSLALLPVRGPVRRADQPGAARRTRRGTKPLYELEIALRAAAGAGRRHCALAGRPPVPQPPRRRRPATPIAPRSASTSSTRRRARWAGSASSSSAPSRCRRTPRMSLAQQLLVRALIARFWEQPYRQPLVRWGTALHDRFMLPHFLWADFESVISRPARRRACRSRRRGSRPTSSSAFPCCGTVERAGVRSSCGRRWSPGSCLGEQGGPGAPRAPSTPRSSACRCWCGAAAADRYAVTCNGYRASAGADRHGGRGRRRRALPRLARQRGLPPQHPPARAADLRHRRHLERPLDRRLPLPCRAARRPQFPGAAGQCAGGRRAPPRPLRGHRPHARQRRAARRSGVHPDFPLTLDLRRVARAE